MVTFILLDDKELYTIIELLEKKIHSIRFVLNHTPLENLDTIQMLKESLEDFEPVCEYLKKWQDYLHGEIPEAPKFPE